MEEFRRGEPQAGAPRRRIDDKHEPAAIEIREPRMRGKPVRQAWA
jgi:hypothetical protein